MTERGAHLSFCRILALSMPPPPTIPKCLLSKLVTEMRDAIIFVGFWRPPMPPPPDATILNHLNDSERGGGGRHYLLYDFGTPQRHLTQTPQYLTILMTERGGGAVIFCRILAPPLPDATILNYLNDRERGRHYFFVGF